MTTHSPDPLSGLVDNGAASINRDRLLALLKPYVRFDSDGVFGFLPPFGKLDGRQKVQIILATAKARALIMPKNHKDGLLHKEIIALEVMAVGTAKSSIKALNDSHKIRQLKDGRYVLPDFLIDGLAERFADDKNRHHD